MESGGGSNNQNGREGRTPPDEEHIRSARARLARGLDINQARLTDVPGGSGGLVGGQAADDGSFQSGADRSVLPGVATTDSPDAGSRRRPWSEPVGAGTGPIRCEFLRSIGADGRLTEAQKTAVPTHRCAAFGDPLPLSLRQQELVCLQRVHVSCPRYVRGTLLATENRTQAQSEDRNRRAIPLVTMAGIVLVILAFGVLFAAFLGLPPLGGGSPRLSPVAIGSPSRSPGAAQSATASRAAGTSVIVVTVAPSARPTATPQKATPTPTPMPAPTSTWPPGATASRMSLLVPCTGQANCYVYTVRGPGPAPSGNGSPVADTLSGIATYFGVDIASIRNLNPWLNGGNTIQPGDQLKIPPPTR